MELEKTIAALVRAELDVNVANLLDALWLATQPGLTLASAIAPPAPFAPPPPPPEPSPPEPVKSGPAGGATGAPVEVPPVESPKTAPGKPLPAAEGARTSIYQGAEGLGGEVVKASPVRIPAGAALPGKLAVARAMRPFRQRWPSPRVSELDEEATADATAEHGGEIALVFRPRPERWFEAVVVTEDALSMDVWHETLAELRQMLLETGAFRNVHTARLGFDAGGPAPGGIGHLQPTLHSSIGGRLSPDGLASSRVRRLIFFATHGISPRWLDGSLAAVLDAWAHTASVVLLHLLPQGLWRHTALGEPRGLVHATAPGAPTSRLKTERFSWDLSLDETTPVVAIPVIPLEPAACFNWAQMEMARGRRAAAMLVPTTPRTLAPEEGPLDPPDFEELVRLFGGYGSALSFRLAVYLSPGPFTLPVARLIQAARFGALAQQSQLAEVMLSGLVRRLTPVTAAAHPDWVQYDVHPEARTVLLRSLREEDAEDVADILQRHVNRFIEESYGKPADFRALVRDEDGLFELPDWAQPFANLGTALLGLDSSRHTAGDGAGGGPELPAPDQSLRRMRETLDEHFGPERVEVYLVRSGDLELARMPFDVGSFLLHSMAVDLLTDEQRRRLAPLAITKPTPLPATLWRKLVDPRDFPPLDSMGGLVEDKAGALIVIPAVRGALLRHTTNDERKALHRRLIEAYYPYPIADLLLDDDGYHYQHYLEHAAACDADKEAMWAIGTNEWVGRKVEVCGVPSLIEDLERFPLNEAFMALAALARKKDSRWEDPVQWAESLLKELSGPSEPAPDETAERRAPAPQIAAVPSSWVLVVGTGHGELDDGTAALAAALGRTLVDQGLGLITGGWPGVDTQVSESYAEARAARSLPVDDGLICVLEKPRESHRPLGRRVVTASEAEYTQQTIGRADVVVLLGGGVSTELAGRMAASRGIPVIPLPVSAGDAASEVLVELVEDGLYARTDLLASTEGVPTEAIVQRVAELLREYRQPRVALRSAAKAYLRAGELVIADTSVEARILDLLRRHPDEASGGWLDADADDADRLLEAFCQRAAPTARGTRRLVERFRTEMGLSPAGRSSRRWWSSGSSSSAEANRLPVTWQRLLAIESAFGVASARAGLDSTALAVLETLYNRPEEEIGPGGLASRVKSLLAQRLLHFSRLIGVADAARSLVQSKAWFPEMSVMAVDDELASNFLRDPDPGWRFVGLARAATDPSQALVADMFGAIRFESTHESQLRAFLSAMRATTRKLPALQLTADQRHQVEGLCRQFDGDSDARGLIAWLSESTAPAESEHDTRLRAAARAYRAALVAEYTRFRQKERPGVERTAHMTSMVGRMLELAVDDPSFDALAWLNNANSGWRLAAYLATYERSSKQFLEPLCESLRRHGTGPRSEEASALNGPFGDYWGLRALERLLEGMDELSPAQHARIEGLRWLAPAGSERAALFSSIMARANFLQARRPSETAGREEPEE